MARKCNFTNLYFGCRELYIFRQIRIPEYVILDDFNFTQGRLYSRYNLPQLDLYVGYLLNLLIVISWTILAKSAPPPAPGKNSVIRGFSVVKTTF